MRRNTSVGLNVAFAIGLVIILAIIVMDAVEGWQKGTGFLTTVKMTAWIELAFILGCTWYAKANGHTWMCCLLGLLGPLGIAMVACLGKEARNSSEQACVAGQAVVQDEGQKQVARKFRLLHWLFWGMVVFWIGANVFHLASLPSIAKLQISYLMKDAVFAVTLASLAFYVLKGAKWARVSCYVLFLPLSLLTLIFWQFMLHVGVLAICDVWIAQDTLADSLFDMGDVLFFMSCGCLMAGTMGLLDSNVEKAFAKMKSSSRFGWIWCLLFWAILIYELDLHILRLSDLIFARLDASLEVERVDFE